MRTDRTRSVGVAQQDPDVVPVAAQWANGKRSSSARHTSFTVIAAAAPPHAGTLRAEGLSMRDLLNKNAPVAGAFRAVLRAPPCRAPWQRRYWWAHLASNQGPTGYEPVALTNWFMGPTRGTQGHLFIIFRPLAGVNSRPPLPEGLSMNKVLQILAVESPGRQGARRENTGSLFDRRATQPAGMNRRQDRTGYSCGQALTP